MRNWPIGKYNDIGVVWLASNAAVVNSGAISRGSVTNMPQVCHE